MRPMKIAMYSPFPSGGMPLYTMEVMKAIHERHGDQITVELVTSQDLQPEFRKAGYAINDILPVLDRSPFRSRLSWLVSRIGYYVRRERKFVAWLRDRPDIHGVHFQDYHPWIIPNAIDRCRTLGKAVFFTVHNIRPHAYPAILPAAFIDLLNRRSWKMCDALFVHGERLRDELSSFLGLPCPPIEVILHGAWSIPEIPGIPSLESRLSRRRILFFGSVRPNKGLHVLLHAMRRLKNFSLTIAGAQDDPSYWNGVVEPLVARLKAEGVTIDVKSGFVPQEEVASLFLSHSVLALPYTEFASQSGVLHLAVAHETPVVASRAGGLDETMAKFRLGEVCAPGDDKELAEAILRLYEKGSYDTLAQRMKGAKEQLSWVPAARVTAATYDTVLGMRDAKKPEMEEREMTLMPGLSENVREDVTR